MTTQDDLDRDWAERVPREFHEAELDALDQAKVRPGVEKWLAKVTDKPGDLRVRGRNLLLYGPIGTGKTFAGFAAMRVLHFEGTPSQQSWAPGRLLRRSWRYWSTPDVLMRLRSREEGLWQELLDARVLFLDDVGTGSLTDWGQELMFNLLNARHADLRPVVATTNLEMDRLEKHIGSLAFSRLVDRAIHVPVFGPNRREAPRFDLVKSE